MHLSVKWASQEKRAGFRPGLLRLPGFELSGFLELSGFELPRYFQLQGFQPQEFRVRKKLPQR